MTNFCNKAEALEVAEELNHCLGRIAKPYGIKIGYHNHTDEFYKDEGKYPLRLADRCLRPRSHRISG